MNPVSRHPIVIAALLAGATLFGTTAGAQVTWTYTAIADSSAELASFSVPAVNDAGEIAFVATFDDPGEGQTLYRYDGPGLLTPIANTAGEIQSFLGNPSINASGVVSFVATMDDDSVSALSGDGTVVNTVDVIVNTDLDGLTSVDSKAFISDTGDAVVVRGVRASDGARVILKGTGAAAPTVLVASTGTWDPQDVAGINDDGIVAFEALTSGGTQRGVYRIDGATVTPVKVVATGGVLDAQALDINNNGTVVYFARNASSVDSLNVDTAGTSTAFAETNSLTFNSLGAASVAESGTVAFRGTFVLGLNAIFAGGTLLYEKATAVGDVLLGSTITALETGPQAVTNAGSFVFRAGRSNGTTGIYAATPGPGSGGDDGGGSSAMDPLALALFAMAALASARRRRRALPQ